jgi:spermidine synthase
MIANSSNPTTRRDRRPRRSLGVALLAVLLGATVAVSAERLGTVDPLPTTGGTVEFETRSDYSHIRVRREGSVRTLTFVEDDGHETRQSAIDLDTPHELRLPYTRSMFASYLFRPDPRRVLIVGLGGGAMVHFLRHHEPDVRIDVVEIDPEVVRVAAEYFGTSPSEHVEIITEDAFEYIERTDTVYDVIYMDAYLEPAPDSDGAGAPLRMKTVGFLETIHSRLEDGGLLVVNFNLTDQLDRDIRNIGEVFPQVRRFRVQGWSNLVVIASTVAKQWLPAELARRAAALDRRFGTGETFQQVVAHSAP